MGIIQSAKISRSLNQLKNVLFLATAYFLTGKLGLLLAIPPGYATAIWPPSGIALAGVLLLGKRVWPGILIGSFAVNVLTSFNPTDYHSLFMSILLPLCIGSGASLQALGGAILLERFVGLPNELCSEPDIIKFLLIAGPLNCIINASISVTCLLFFGSLSLSNYPFHWFTWWAGDAIGVLIFTPLAFILLAEPREIWRRRRLSVGMPLVIMFTLSCYIFIYVNNQERNRIQLEFSAQAERISQTIEKAFDVNLEVLKSIHSFFDATPHVSRSAFRKFVRQALTDHSAIQALEWIPRISESQRFAFETTARSNGYDDFQITEKIDGELKPALNRPEYFPVYFVQPYDGNQVALGYDLYSDNLRRESLMKSRDSGEAIATSRITLVQETAHQSGFLIFLPVYDKSRSIDTIEQRRKALTGFVLGVFRVGDTIDRSLVDTDLKGIDLTIEDHNAATGDTLLYRRSSRNMLDSSSAARISTYKSWGDSLNLVSTIKMPGRYWTIEFQPTLDYFDQHRTYRSWAVLTICLFFSAVMGAFFLVLSGRNESISQLVRERTAELSLANKSLELEIGERQRAEISLKSAHSELEYRVQQRTEDLSRANQSLSMLVAELRQSEKTISEHKNRLKSLVAELSSAEERERRRIATALHENIGQILALIKIDLGALVVSIDSPKTCSEIHEIRELTDQVIQFVRTMTVDLSPPMLYELGFNAAIARLMEQFKGRYDVDFHLETSGTERNLDDGMRIFLFNIARELVVNVVKHARASKAMVKIEHSSDHIKITVEDDGIGYDPSDIRSDRNEGFGLLNLCERINSFGGRIEITAHINSGTTVTAIVPYLPRS